MEAAVKTPVRCTAMLEHTPVHVHGGSCCPQETYAVTTNPILMPGNVEPRYSEFVTFIGIGVDYGSDTQLYYDATSPAVRD